jgi:hypothetical protein
MPYEASLFQTLLVSLMHQEEKVQNVQEFDLKMVHEITGKGRHKIFVYQDYLDILNQGTEPLGK